MPCHLPLFVLVILVLVAGCADTADRSSPTPTDASQHNASQTASPASATATTSPPPTTANIGTADRPWDVKVWNRRSDAVSVTVRIEQNETGVVFEEQLELGPDESRKLTVEFPEAGNYTISTTVNGSTATATVTESETTVSEYSFEIETVPPGFEVIVHLEDDGSVSFFEEAA